MTRANLVIYATMALTFVVALAAALGIHPAVVPDPTVTGLAAAVAAVVTALANWLTHKNGPPTP